MRSSCGAASPFIRGSYSHALPGLADQRMRIAAANERFGAPARSCEWLKPQAPVIAKQTGEFADREIGRAKVALALQRLGAVAAEECFDHRTPEIADLITRGARHARVTDQMRVVRIIVAANAQEDLVGKPERERRRGVALGVDRRVEFKIAIGNDRGRHRHDHAVGLDQSLRRDQTHPRAAMVDHRDRAIEPNRQALAVSGDQRAIALDQPPIVVAGGILIRRPIVQRDGAQVRAIGIARNRVDQRAPGIVGLDEVGKRPVGTAGIGFGAVTELLIGAVEGILIGACEAEIVPLLTPACGRAVDLEPLGQRDPRPGIAIGRMQPGTAEVERFAADAYAMRSSADPRTRLEQQHVGARIKKAPRGSDAGGASSNDDELAAHPSDLRSALGTGNGRDQAWAARQNYAAISRFSPANRIITFCSFSNARTSIWRTRSRDTP
jgi:hypothetical protein